MTLSAPPPWWLFLPVEHLRAPGVQGAARSGASVPAPAWAASAQGR